ncbi:uncharacterized protein LOC112090655 [Morus notabilis]|uniref:uncharacterized protein LOC112090655 n=1 Tax=Morus notabilis TaxID=981085 RepID=UPI000CECFC6E|nr:uncharacterized protein LOC112090655 [Morus notabilis]
MDFLKEGGSVTCPPLLDGLNYSYWNARMMAFIKAQDEKAWRAILNGWKHPVTKDAEGKEILKSKGSWNSDENKLAIYNSRALNAIFNGVDINQFKMISTCESAKEAWEIAHEGTVAIRQSKLNILTTRFENLRMHETETISEFNSRLCDIANESFALGEKIPEVKLVSKALRSLPQRFAYKVTAIEEAKNTETMRLDELMGSLRTFEMNLSQTKKEKEISQGITFQAEVEDNVEEDEDFAESLARLTKNFNRVMKKFNEKNQTPTFNNSNNFQKNKGATNSSNDKKKNMRIQCRECDSYGHIQSECANTLKKRNKSLNVTWSDEDSEGNQEDDDHVNNYVAFNVYQDVLNCNITDRVTAHVATSSATTFATHSGKLEENIDFSDSDGSSDGEELTEETIKEAYETMFNKWVLIVKMNKSLRERIDELIKEKDVLRRAAVNYEFRAVEREKKLLETRFELEYTQKSFKMMNSGTTKLDHIISIGKASGDRHDLDYTGESSTSKIMFVKKTSAPKPLTSSSKKVTISSPRHRWFVPTCHYCGLLGHIRPRCYKYLNDWKNGMFINPPNFTNSKKTPNVNIDVQNNFSRRVWVRKSDLRCHKAYTSLEACTNDCGCSDAGCTKRLTSVKSIIHGRMLHSGGVRHRKDSRGVSYRDQCPQRYLV